MASQQDTGPATPAAPGCAGPTRREAELLEAALSVLQDHGFDRFTVDEVAARAKASKTTLYRRWPSKSELVVAAFTHGVLRVQVAIDTGSLRGDLIELGDLVVDQVNEHGATIGAIVNELRHGEGLRDAYTSEFMGERRRLMVALLDRAVERGEIGAHAVSEELWDLLPVYLASRAIFPGRPPSRETVVALVDEVLLPALRRPDVNDPGPQGGSGVLSRERGSG
ncbi:TetR/AcrR family transcriptional regulator [Nocardioides sp.]|uniref:TetR/AcrR family transcriptional regulator n=1 Tax=Nocardioides sp. TaxID=35761 RepID=UPI00321A7BD0